MKITALDITYVSVNPVRGNWTFCELRTDEGLVGLGEATNVHDPLRVVAALHQLEPRMVGRDLGALPNIEAFVQEMSRPEILSIPHVVTALSGLETALWDLKGQALGVPVHDLLGGKLRDRIRLYANLNRKRGLVVSPEGFAAASREAVQDGFTAVKFFPFYGYMDGTHIHDGRLEDAVREEGLARVAAVRHAVGPDVDVLLQLPPYTMSMDQTIELADALAVYRPFWYQGTFEQVEDQAEFCRKSSVPVTSPARGGLVPGRSNWAPMLSAGGMNITNPDLMSVGGLWEMKKIAVAAEEFGVAFSPHSPYGPVHTLADVHLCATLANFCILEYSIAEAPWRGTVTIPGEEIADGYAVVPDRPGLGVTLDEAVARLHPLGPYPATGTLDPVWGTRGTQGQQKSRQQES